MIKIVLNLLIYIGYFILFINLILFIKGFRVKTKALNLFTIYLLVIFIIQITSGVLFNLKIDNLYLSHFYFVFQFIILSFFYYEILNNIFQRKVIKIVVPLCLIILGVQYYFNLDLFYKFNLFEIFITSFFVIIFSMFHFYNMLNEKRVYYYLNTGIFIYLFGSTFLFITGNLINSLTDSFRGIIWILNAILYILYQIFIFVEFKNNFEKKLDNE